MTRTPLLATLIFLSLQAPTFSLAAKEKMEIQPASHGNRIQAGTEPNSNPDAGLDVHPLFRETEKKYLERGAQADKRIEALRPLLKDANHPDYQKNFCEMVKESMYGLLAHKIRGKKNPFIESHKDFFSFAFTVSRQNKPAFALTYAYTDQGVDLLVTLVAPRMAYIGIGENTQKGQELYASALGCLFTFYQKDPFALKSEPSS